MLALLVVGLIWLASGFLVARLPIQPRFPRYPTTSITIPTRLGPFPLTDAEVVDYFLRMDWKLRLDQPVAAGREW